MLLPHIVFSKLFVQNVNAPMRLTLFLNKILLKVIIVILFFFTVLSVVYYLQLHHLKKMVTVTDQSNEILLAANKITFTAIEIETSSSAYLLSGLQQFRQTYLQSKINFALQKNYIRKIITGDKLQLQMVDSLLWYVDKKIALTDSVISIQNPRSKLAVLPVLTQNETLLFGKGIYKQAGEISQQQNRLLEQQKDELYNALTMQHWINVALIFLLLVSICFFIIKKKLTGSKKEVLFEENASRLSLQINQSNDAVFTLDINQKIVSWNSAAENLYGYSRYEALGKDSNTLLRTNIINSEKNIIMDEPTPHHYQTRELARKTKNGQSVFVSSSVTAIKNGEDIITGYVAVSFDITAQKILSKQVNYIESMVEQSSEAIFSRGIDQRIISWNSGAEKLFGYASHEAIGKTIADLQFIKFTSQQITGVENLIADTGTWQEEVKYYHKDGSSFFGLVTGNCIKNSAGDITAFYFIVKDISVRKQLEEKLQQFNDELEQKVKDRTEQIAKNERRFLSLIENDLDVISLMDESFKIIYRSPSAQRILGWSDADMQEEDGTKNIHPDELAHARNVVRLILNNPGKPICTLFRNKHKDGHYLWLEGIVINRLHNEDVKAIVFNCRDVTNRIQGEALLREERDKFAIFAATVPGLIYSFKMNMDGSPRFTFVSKDVINIFGFTGEEVLSDASSILKLWHPDDIDPLYNDFKTSAKNITPWHKEFRYLHPVKGEVWLEANSMPVAQTDGTIIWHGIISDIQSRKVADQKIIKANRLYLFISQINHMIVRTTDETSLFKEACKIAVDCGKFGRALITIIDDQTSKLNTVMQVDKGMENYDADKINITENNFEKSGPIGAAIQKGTYIVCNDFENELPPSTKKEDVMRRGYNSLMALPIKKFDIVIGAFTLYSAEKNFFDAAEIELLLGVTVDVSFALENFEKEALRKKADADVIESEARYYTLTESCPVGIFRTDAKGYTTYVNPSWCIISGLSFQQALGNGWLTAVHKDDREMLANNWTKEVTGCRVSFSEYRFVHPDDTVSRVIGQAIPEKNAASEVIGYVGTITDVTANKEAEDLIFKQKQLTETLINNLPGIFYLYNKEGNFIRWNKNFEKVTGYDDDEIGKMSPFDFYDDDERDKIKDRIRRVFEKKSPGIEVVLCTKSKKKIPYYINSLKINYLGKDCILGLGVDLSERKAAEREIMEASERFELIGKATSDGVWDWNVVTNKIWGNEMHQQLYGLTVADPVPEYDEWANRIHPNDRARTMQLLEDAQASDSKILVDEYRFYSDKTGWKNILSRILIQRNNAGEPIRLIGSMVDVTQLKTAENKLIEKSVQLEKLSDNLPGLMLYQLTGNRDGSRKFNYVSNGSLAITGRTPQEIIDDPSILYNIIHKEDRLKMADAEIESYLTMKPFNVEVRCLNHKGEMRWLMVISSPKKLNDEETLWDGFHVDITDRKLAEEIIIKSKERLELAEELAQLGSWEFDVENKIGKWSKQMFRFFGFEESIELPSFKELSAGIHLEDRILFIEFWQNISKGSEHNNIRIFRTNPILMPLRYLQASFNINKNKNNKIVKISGTVLDITERLSYEQQVIASEEKYRILVEEASDGIFISNASGRFITVNASACKLTQHTEDELMQMSIYDFFIEDDINERPIQFETLKEGKVVISERVMKRKDGHFNHLEITSKLLTDGRLLSFVRDVAERKKAEETLRLSNERYNLVAKATNDAIWDLNILTGEIIHTGDGFKNLLEHDNGGTDYFSAVKFIHPDDMTAIETSMKTAFNHAENDYWKQEYRILKNDGTYSNVFSRGSIIRDKNGKAIRMIVATQDITKLKKNELKLISLNQELLIQAKALSESNAELEQFAYVASHDLQEPLRMVTSFLNLLEINYSDKFDDKGKKYIHFAVDGAKRMRQIIIDLLEISKVGRSEGNMELIDLNLLVNEILQLLQKQIGENKAIIEVGALPVLHANRSSLIQIFQNLVGNSLKYKRKDIATQIKITATGQDKYWQFSVADNGIGIEEEYFTKIFIIFQRLHNQNEFSGTGIGLAITKKIIEKLGGKIWLQSEPGRGTTFYFTIKK